MLDADREAARQKALADLDILDTAPEQEFDVSADKAQRLLGTCMSSITLTDPTDSVNLMHPWRAWRGTL